MANKPMSLEEVMQNVMERINETAPLPEDNILNQPVCQTCNGIGSIMEVLEAGIPGVSAPKQRLIPCPDCEKGHQRQRQILDNRLQRTRLPHDYETASFEDWGNVHDKALQGKVQSYLAAIEFATHPAHRVSSHAVARRILHHFNDVPKWVRAMLEVPDDARFGLVFYGDYGVGKTWIAAAAMNHMAEHGEYVLYMRMSRLVDTLRDTWKSDEQTGKLLSHYCDVPTLFIDDMSNNSREDDPLPAHMQDFAATIIRERLDNHRPTLITTNWGPNLFSAKWGRQCAEVAIAKCHWIEVAGAKLRDTAPKWGTL